jgi:hypothetical protein
MQAAERTASVEWKFPERSPGKFKRAATEINQGTPAALA